MSIRVFTNETRKANAISKSFVRLFSAAFLVRKELYQKSSSLQWGIIENLWVETEETIATLERKRNEEGKAEKCLI